MHASFHLLHFFQSHNSIVSSLAVDSFPGCVYSRNISRLWTRLFLVFSSVFPGQSGEAILVLVGWIFDHRHKAFHRDRVNMLSDLWSKFFLNKFLQNFPDIFTFRIHFNMCIILVSFDYFNREIISYLWLYVLEYSVWTHRLELVFRTSSHFGRVGLWYRIDFIWLFQSWNHMVFIVTFMGYFVWIHHLENMSNLQDITKSCIHANWFHLIISVVKSYRFIRTICWDIRIELISHHAVVKREQKGALAASLYHEET